MLADGRVMTVTAGRTSLALTHFNGSYGALDNHCPHQGGPLGEGSIERETTAEPTEGEAGVESTHRKAWLRCPWHGYDYDPITGTPPPGFTDAPNGIPVEVRGRRRLRRACRPSTLERARSPTSWSTR